MAKKTSSKKKSAKKFAPYGIVLSAISLIAGVFFLVIKLLVLMQIYSPPNQNWINLALLISLGTFIIGFAFFSLLDPKRVRELIAGRQAKHGSNALIILLSLVGIIVVVNLLIYQNPKQWDWTENKEHTLAPETLATLSSLPSKITALAFFTQNYSSTTAEELLTDFRENSTDMFDFQIIDPERNPVLAQQYKITRDGTIVLIMDERQEILTISSEQEMTSAIIRLMNPEERVIYFMTGHGEADISKTGDTGITNAVEILENKNYLIRTLNLQAENEIPSDALTIIIVGPTRPFTESEALLLSTYLDNGGALVVLEQSIFDPQPGLDTDPLLEYLSAFWGVHFNGDLVVDPTSPDPVVAISSRYGNHEITADLVGTNTIFPVARSLTISSLSTEIIQNPLIFSVDRAWGETDAQSLAEGVVEFQPETDISGPITIAAALENTSTGGKLVVFGDSSFATNGYFYYGNIDLFSNSLDWASGEQDMINLTPKDTTQRSLNSIRNVGWILLGLSFICIIPGIIIAGGVISWIARRTRG